MGNYKTLNVRPKTKKVLGELKLVPTETYDNLIRRIIITSSMTGGTI